MRTVLTLLAFCAVAAAQARVEGRVVSSTGEPVRKATVRMGGGQPSVSYVEVTGSDGRFQFENVAPARYVISAQKLGFAAPVSSPPFVVAAGESKRDVEVRLTPLSAVSGTVTDSDGDPVPNVQVSLLRRAYVRGRMRLQAANASGPADDRGRFRIPNVTPGRYYVMASDPSARSIGTNATEIRGRSALEANLATYHPGSSDVGGAILVDLKAGSESTNVDVRMRRGRTSSARGVVVDEGGAPVQAQLTLYSKTDEGPSANTQLSARPGTGAFEFRGLAPGEYTVLARVEGAQPRAEPVTVRRTDGLVVEPPKPPPPPPPPSPSLTGRLDFSIGSGDLENLSIRMAKGPEITGRIRLEGGGELSTFLQNSATNAPRTVTSPDGTVVIPAVRASVALSSDEGVSSSWRTADDGTFRVPNLSPSRYTVSVAPLAPGAYVKSIRWGTQDITNALLDLTGGIGGAIEIVLSPRAAALNGTAAAGSMVTLWPAVRLVNDSQGGVRNLRASAQGTFQFGGLAPGEYYVAAWEEVAQDLARIPEFLDLFRAAAAKVRVGEGETAAVEPRPISKDAAERAVGEFR